MFKIFSLSFSNKIICVLIWCIFVALSLYIAPYHEIWADEVQAFLIARDASFSDIISIIPHHEGQPSLWHLLLKGLIFLFGENLNITYVSISIMAMTVGIFLFGYQVPLIYKILIPFGHYFLYQYNIISRNYCLAYLALVILGYIYPLRHKYIWRYTLALLLLAESTTFYTPVAVMLGLIWLYEGWKITQGKIKNYLFPIAMLAFFVGTLLWQLLPMPEMNFTNTTSVSIYSRHLITPNYPLYILKHLFYSLFDVSFLIASYFLLCFYMMRDGVISVFVKIWQTLKGFRIGFVCFGVFIIVFYLAIPLSYHQGLIWGLFLFTCYISTSQQKLRHTNTFLVLLIFLQLIRGIIAVLVDINIPVSAQNQSIDIIRTYAFQTAKIRLFSYNALPLKLLVKREILSISQDSPLYHRWDKDIFSCKQAMNKNSSILIIGADIVSTCQRYLKNNDYYLYIVPAFLPFPQTETFLDQTHYIFIPKKLHIEKTN